MRNSNKRGPAHTLDANLGKLWESANCSMGKRNVVDYCTFSLFSNASAPLPVHNVIRSRWHGCIVQDFAFLDFCFLGHLTMDCH